MTLWCLTCDEWGLGARGGCKQPWKAVEEGGNRFLLAEQGTAKEAREATLKAVRKTQGKRGNIIKRKKGQKQEKIERKEGKDMCLIQEGRKSKE